MRQENSTTGISSNGLFRQCNPAPCKTIPEMDWLGLKSNEDSNLRIEFVLGPSMGNFSMSSEKMQFSPKPDDLSNFCLSYLAPETLPSCPW